MTTGGSGTGNAREDELLARLYDQLTELLTDRFGAGYEAAAGLDRFGAWLGEHAAAAEAGPAAVQAGSPAAAQASPGARSPAAIPSTGPGEAVIASRIMPETGDTQGEAQGAWADKDADRGMTALYEGHYSALVRLAALLVGDMAIAEQIVQDSFVALRLARQRRDSDSALSYLRQSVVSRSRSALPHRGGRNVPAAAQGRPAAQRAAMAAPGDPAVMAALRALPARQRAVLVLRYYADLSEAQIAEIMGISVSAVGRHTERASAALRAVLDSAPE